MAKATYVQPGNNLDYINNGSAAIEAGDVIALGTTRVGVAGCDIAVGEVGSVIVKGVFEFPKTGTAAIALGAAVYFDGTGITNADSGNTPAGYAVAAAEASSETILVKLLG